MRTHLSFNLPTPKKFRFEAIKFLKSAIDFKIRLGENNTGISTELVRIEKFQGYSKGSNFDFYYRLRDTSNWKKCTLVTGLIKTTRKNHFYGDFREGKTKTLLLFVLSPDRRSLEVYEYPKGYYPRTTEIERLVHQL